VASVDGNRRIRTPEQDRREMDNGLTFVTRNDGLREALLPDGRVVYRDRYVMVPGPAGTPVRMIERTHFIRWVGHRPVPQPQPVVRYYDALQLHGAPAALYRPVPVAPTLFQGFYAPLPGAVVMAGAGFASPPVQFAAPPQPYTDPAALMGDLQITSGFEDGSSQAWTPQTRPAPTLSPPPTPVEERGAAAGAPRAGASASAPATAAAPPVVVSDEVREQMRQQVRLSVAMLQNGHPLLLNDVLAAGYASIYLFQVAQPIWVPLTGGSGECLLNTGDLIVLDKSPGADARSVDMSVVAASAASCRAGEGVRVAMADLQEMLNAFTIRVEENLKRLSACAGSGRC